MLRVPGKNGCKCFTKGFVFYRQIGPDAGCRPFPGGFLFNDGLQCCQFALRNTVCFNGLAVQPFQLFFAEAAAVAVLLVQAVHKVGLRVGLYHFF